MEKTVEYCACVLPIKMIRRTADMYKKWYCAACTKPVNPESKMISKYIEKLDIKNPTRNETVLQNKINEILELMGANGDFIQ
jgi:hypothetical protein